MRRMWEMSRRGFFRLLGTVTFLRVSLTGEPAAAQAATAPVDAVAPGFRVLTPHEVRTVEAIAAQLMPADDYPGARETGVVHYVDRVLTGEQRHARGFYADGLRALDATARRLHGAPFAELAGEHQVSLLRAADEGTLSGPEWQGLVPSDFFHLLWMHTLEGFYGGPEHGGNRDYASWKMLGYPLVH